MHLPFDSSVASDFHHIALQVLLLMPKVSYRPVKIDYPYVRIASTLDGKYNSLSNMCGDHCLMEGNHRFL